MPKSQAKPKAVEVRVIRLTRCAGDFLVKLYSDGSGLVSSNLRPSNEPDWNHFVDGVESLVLACACAGIDIESRSFQEAVETAVESGSNRLL